MQTVTPGAPSKALHSKKRKVLLVEDHPLLRGGLAALINSEPDFEVCGETDRLASAEQLAHTLRADIVVVDAMLRDECGLDLIQSLARTNPHILTLMLSMYDEAVYAERALRFGARGYVMKSQPPATVITALRQVVAGKIYLSPMLRKRIGSSPVNSSPVAVPARHRSAGAGAIVHETIELGSI
jgi:DNA-binding NarL/FixJ family response regulator